MAGKRFREPIKISSTTTQSDLQMGQVATETVVGKYNCLAWILEKPISAINTDLQDFRNRQTLEIAYNPDQPIQYSDYVEWRGKKLTIESVAFNDNQTLAILQTVSK